MKYTASGAFTINLAPLNVSAIAENSGLGRLSLDKRFSGDLQATSQGEMLSFRSAVDGSAGYVAMEKVSGTLHGRNGSFVLQHSSTLTRGSPHQSISVVPDSATGDLSGLRGTMVIEIDDGQHSYLFDYDFDR